MTTEIWMVVTICLAAQPTPSAGSPATACVDYRTERPYASLAACNRDLGIIEGLRGRGIDLISSLCSRRVDPERLGRMPVLPVTAGRPT